MTNEHKYQKISAEVRVSNGIAYGFVLGLVDLAVSCSGAQGNVNATLTGAGLASAAGFAYGMASATEKDVKEHNERQQRILEQNELTTLLNKPRRFVAMIFNARKGLEQQRVMQQFQRVLTGNL